jgi:predicted site-specific integrase-resolvase
MTPEYMTIEEFAQRAGLTYSTARRACIAGEVPGAIKWLSQWRIPETVFAEKAQEVAK